MGIAGAAIATSIAQFTTMIMLFRQYLGKSTILHLNLKRISYDKELVSELIKMGSPTLFRQILVSTALGIMNASAAKYSGDVGIASIGIVIKLGTIITLVILGFGQGFQVVAGYNYGAKMYSRVIKSINFSVMVSFLFCTITSVLFIIFDEQILSIFQPSEQVMEVSKKFIVWYGVSMVLMSISNIISVFYQAIGEAKHALILSISRQGTFFIPAILVLPKLFGIMGVLITPTVADALTILLSVILFIPSYQKLCEHDQNSYYDEFAVNEYV